MTHPKWIYKDHEISSIEELPEYAHGFVYMIMLPNDK